MNVVLDEDARRYLMTRRAESVFGVAEAMTPQVLRAEEARLRERYGHGPAMHNEWSYSASEAALQSEAPTMRDAADENIVTNAFPATDDSVSAGRSVASCVVLDPTAKPKGTLVYVHGGGWVMGESADYLAVCRALAAASGWRVVVADYRKAPEDPFPAGLEDVVGLLRLVVDGEEGLRAGGPIAVGGDSAGANIAASAAKLLAAGKETAERAGSPDREVPAGYAGSSGQVARKVDAQVLITPVLDTDLDTRSYRDPARQLSLTRDAMAWFLDQYVPSGMPREDERIAPLRSKNFGGFAPTLFVEVASDVLFDEGRAFQEKLREAGVPVRTLHFSGQMHGFFQLYSVMPAAARAVEWIATELKAITEERSATILRTKGDER